MKLIIFLLSLLILTGLIPTIYPDNFYPVRIQQINGEYVDWTFLIVHDILEYPIWCRNAGQYTVGCTNYNYKLMLIEDKFYQYEGIDTFTHEYLHARCDYNGGNWHKSNTNPIYNSTENYWVTCGR